AFSNNQPKVYFHEHQFYTPEGGNYIEIHLHFVGPTITYIKKDSQFRGALKIVQQFSQNDTAIITDKYILDAPPTKDSIFLDFHDFRRYGLAPGKYSYSLFIKDIHSNGKPLKVTKSITVHDESSTILISPI